MVRTNKQVFQKLQTKLRDVVSLDGHVLLKKLRDALEYLKGRMAGQNKEDMEKAISMVSSFFLFHFGILSMWSICSWFYCKLLELHKLYPVEICLSVFLSLGTPVSHNSVLRGKGLPICFCYPWNVISPWFLPTSFIVLLRSYLVQVKTSSDPI